jgi:hypothetical protein
VTEKELDDAIRKDEECMKNFMDDNGVPCSLLVTLSSSVVSSGTVTPDSLGSDMFD